MRKLYFLILIFLTAAYVFPAGSKVIKPKNVTSQVKIIISGKSRIYYSLPVKDSSIITVRGPGKLEMISRIQFAPGQNQPLDYTIYYRVDGGKKIEKKFNSITKSNDAVYKDASLGFPGTGEKLTINLSGGEHSIELWLGSGSPGVAARYLFTKKKEKKIDWVAISPLAPKEPVYLTSTEDLLKYYRFSEKKPLKIKITGPTTIKILTRVENHYYMKGRINYRLQVKEDRKVKNTYLLNSVRSAVTRYKNDGSKIPGKAKEIVLDVRPGSHTYEIIPLDKDKGTVLGRVLFPKKDIKLED